MRLDGFGIFVERMPAMVRFYRDVLGFEIREDENASNVYLEGRNAVPALPQGGFREDDRPQVRLCRPGERALRDRPERRKPCGGRCGLPRGRRQRRPARHGTHNRTVGPAHLLRGRPRRQPDRNRVVQGMIPEWGCSISDFWRFICKTVT